MEGPSLLSRSALLLSSPVLSPNFIRNAWGVRLHLAPCDHFPLPSAAPRTPQQSSCLCCPRNDSSFALSGCFSNSFLASFSVVFLLTCENLSSHIFLSFGCYFHIFEWCFFVVTEDTGLSPPGCLVPAQGLSTSAAFPLLLISKFPCSLFHFEWRKWILMCLWYQALVLDLSWNVS